MYVERIPNRSSPPAILLRESYRDGAKIKKRTLANLSDWPQTKIEALRRVLRGETVAAPDRQALVMLRSLPHGHVAAALGSLRKLGLDRLLSGLIALAIGREIDFGAFRVRARPFGRGERAVLGDGLRECGPHAVAFAFFGTG